MAYWLDDGFDSWPEVVRAGTAAVGLYVRCGSWIARNLTDGFVPLEVARMYGTAEWITRLVDAGLWTIEEAGYRDVRYFPMNPTAEKVRKRREDAAERQRKMRERRNAKLTRDSRVSNRGSHASPASSPKGEEGGAGAAARPAPHPYQPDGYGCANCNLPEPHRIHQIRSVS